MASFRRPAASNWTLATQHLRVLGGLFWRISVTKKLCRKKRAQPYNRASRTVNLGVPNGLSIMRKYFGGALKARERSATLVA
jgi:hypothetical protein